jgi:hypothetical protein
MSASGVSAANQVSGQVSLWVSTPRYELPLKYSDILTFVVVSLILPCVQALIQRDRACPTVSRSSSNVKCPPAISLCVHDERRPSSLHATQPVAFKHRLLRFSETIQPMYMT